MITEARVEMTRDLKGGGGGGGGGDQIHIWTVSKFGGSLKKVAK